MLTLGKPQSKIVRRFLDAQASLDFTYTGVGTTATQPLTGYVIDHTRAKLGRGERVFDMAKSALEQWRQFRLGWVDVWSNETPIREGEVVAVVARVAGVWWLNACRIVYVINDRQPVRRFGFAYGTLPDHAESGEERFLLEMDESEEVWYDILAFSRPRHVLARLAYPYVRVLQRRFGRASVAEMLNATAEGVICSPTE